MEKVKCYNKDFQATTIIMLEAVLKSFENYNFTPEQIQQKLTGLAIWCEVSSYPFIIDEREKLENV